MNPKTKKRWIEALRSGDYKQYKCGLRRAYISGQIGHCCLGVLCDILPQYSVAAGGGTYVSPRGAWLSGDTLNLDTGKYVAGLSRQDAGTLASMNDQGVSFEEIADWIEANL